MTSPALFTAQWSKMAAPCVQLLCVQDAGGPWQQHAAAHRTSFEEAFRTREDQESCPRGPCHLLLLSWSR